MEDFLEKRVISVRTKLDLHNLAGMEEPEEVIDFLEGTTSNGQVPFDKKFCLTMPHFKQEEASKINAEKFRDMLEECDAEDNRVLRESLPEKDFVDFQPLVGFNNFANGLHQQFKALFMKEKLTTQEALNANVKSLDVEVELLEDALQREEGGNLENAAHHFSHALRKVATTTGEAVWYPRAELEYGELEERKQYKGTSLRSDIEKFQEHNLLKDQDIYGGVAVAYNKLLDSEDAKGAKGECSASKSDAEEDAKEGPMAMKLYKSHYILSGFEQHLEGVQKMDKGKSYFEKLNYGAAKLKDALRELRAYIKSQTLSLELKDYLEFVEQQPFDVLDRSFEAEKERRKLFENFISNRISEILLLNMNVVGHRVVRLFEGMIDPAVYWLMQLTEEPASKRNDMKDKVHVGMKLKNDEAFRSEFKAKYKLFLKEKLYTSFEQHTTEEIKFFCASNPLKLLESSTINALNVEPFDPEDTELSIETIRREMIAKRVDNFFKDNDRFCHLKNIPESNLKTAESMKLVTEEVWNFALIDWQMVSTAWSTGS